MASLDQTIKFEANKAYPSIPTISADLQSLTNAANLMKHAIEIHERRTPDALQSFVRLEELVTLGLITVNGDILQLNRSVGGADASGVHNELSLRDAQDAHTIGSITQLAATLDNLGDRITVNEGLIDNHETRILSLEDLLESLDYFLGE
ncbi:MAG: hypothetical protein KAJ55_08950 [Anaerolineales bacterium]|nr:hypothetical protein [Anaerolineales bacterium]